MENGCDVDGKKWDLGWVGEVEGGDGVVGELRFVVSCVRCVMGLSWGVWLLYLFFDIFRRCFVEVSVGMGCMVL